MGDFVLGTAFSSLEEQMRFRLARQVALASNLANADTPGYRRVDLHFDEVLDQAASRLRSSDPGHLRGEGERRNYRVEVGPRGERPDGKGVNVDAEIVRANRNAGAFKDMASIMGRIVAMRKFAISGR